MSYGRRSFWWRTAPGVLPVSYGRRSFWWGAAPGVLPVSYGRGPGRPEIVDLRCFRPEIDPGHPLDRRGAPRTSICTSNPPRRPILMPFRGTQKLPPDCLQVPRLWLWLKDKETAFHMTPGGPPGRSPTKKTAFHMTPEGPPGRPPTKRGPLGDLYGTFRGFLGDL